MVKRLLTSWFRRQLIPRIEEMAAPELPDRLLANCRLCSSRKAILAHLPKGGVIAEVGIGRGDFSEVLLQEIEPELFVAIDLFPHDNQLASYRKRFESRLADSRMQIVEGYSWEALKTFPDSHFDYIYLDADHSYGPVKKDIGQMLQKMKPDGLLQFNDYCTYSPKEFLPYGVKRAVHELMIQHDFEMLYFGLQANCYYDVVLRKASV